MAGPEPIPLFTGGGSTASPPTGGWVAAVDSAFAETLTTSHLRVFECVARDTNLGAEQVTRDVPNRDPEGLDERGVVEVGRQVSEGDLLIGKVTPLGGEPASPEKKLLRAIFGEKAGDRRDTSVYVPPWLGGEVIAAELTEGGERGVLARASVTLAWERRLEIGDTIEVGGRRATVCAIGSLPHRLAIDGQPVSGAVSVIEHARDRIEARSIGPYSLISQQPLTGRESFGGQTLTAGQRGALVTAGARALLPELLAIKSDAVLGRIRSYESIIKGEDPEL
jgi:DNA-directed RNA polymerase beta subunit